MEQLDLMIQTLNKIYRVELGTKPREELHQLLTQAITVAHDRHKEDLISVEKAADSLRLNLKSEQSNHRTTITALSASEAELKRVKAELKRANEHAQYLATELAGMDIALCKETEQSEKLKDILIEAFRKAL